MNWYFVGVDSGQSREFTAIAVVERVELQGEWDAVMWAWRKKTELLLRCLARLPLGTPYPEVVDEVRQVTGAAALQGQRHLVVDATGVGRPVVDLLRSAGLGCTLMPVVITGGDAETTSELYPEGSKEYWSREGTEGFRGATGPAGVGVA